MPRRDTNLMEILAFLLDAPLFSSLDQDELLEILPIVQARRLRDGQKLFREGDMGDAWYVVFRGRAVVTKSQIDGEDRQIAVLGPPACVGEMAILDGSPRSATVRADGDCTVLRFPRDSFEELLHQDSLAAYKLIFEMAKVLCERQRKMTFQFTELLTRRQITEQEVRDQIGPLIDDHALSE